MSTTKTDIFVPTEIIELTIDHLYNDKAALRACSLVSRNWVPASRYHLIHSVSITSSNCPGLIDILSQPYTRLAVSVRHLRIKGDGLEDDAEEAWLNEALPSLLKHFRFIQSLLITRIKWSKVDLQSLSLFQSFQELKKLTLVRNSCKTLEQMGHLINSFPSLRHLVLAYNSTDADEIPPINPLNFGLPKIARLSLVNESVQTINWVSRWFPGIEDLVINFDHLSAAQLDNIRILIARAGKHLKHLSFQFCGDLITTKQETGLSLAENPSLESLTLRLAFPIFFCADMSINCITPFIASISSPSFSVLTFRSNLYYPRNLKGIDWASIDEVFSRRRNNGDGIKGNGSEIVFELPEYPLQPATFRAEVENTLCSGLQQTTKAGCVSLLFSKS